MLQLIHGVFSSNSFSSRSLSSDPNFPIASLTYKLKKALQLLKYAKEDANIPFSLLFCGCWCVFLWWPGVPSGLCPIPHCCCALRPAPLSAWPVVVLQLSLPVYDSSVAEESQNSQITSMQNISFSPTNNALPNQCSLPHHPNSASVRQVS